MEVSKVLLHPKLDPTNGIEGDVALLQLENEPELGERVKTFGLQNLAKSSKEDKNIHKKKGACIVPGYGFIKWDKFQTLLPTTMRKYSPAMLKPSICTGGEIL
ncbi:uncharacterized protein LOC132754461 [Ruditapes philippinarum]|uniref:uncharacterized protein LOC132754461 n=1 Tax=Ruditapes philippinarum TaxID=129788 RepID=UPI00295B4DEF|nr:uncharacterized protein LOC132754461 [Ruditapes philippinarum]